MEITDSLLKVWAVVGPLLGAAASAAWNFYVKKDDREWSRSEVDRALSRERAEAHVLEARRLMAQAATHAQTATTKAASARHDAAIDEIAKGMSVTNSLRLLTNSDIGDSAHRMNAAATHACLLAEAKHAGLAKEEEFSSVKEMCDLFLSLCKEYLDRAESNMESRED